MRRYEFVAVAVVLVALAIITLFVKKLWIDRPITPPAAAESHLTKVIRNGEIRCSYLVYSPYFRKDPNSRELSGIFHDLMEEIGKKADPRINWVEEVGYENIFAGLDSGRYDVFAGGLWPSTSRAKAGSFTIPVFYSVIKSWGRTKETRFANLEGIDSPGVRSRKVVPPNE
ncbi:MAG: transporter substrate-binding domain-containing protein [Gammaproteobacteria bacterium]